MKNENILEAEKVMITEDGIIVEKNFPTQGECLTFEKKKDDLSYFQKSTVITHEGSQCEFCGSSLIGYQVAFVALKKQDLIWGAKVTISYNSSGWGECLTC